MESAVTILPALYEGRGKVARAFWSFRWDAAPRCSSATAATATVHGFTGLWDTWRVAVGGGDEMGPVRVMPARYSRPLSWAVCLASSFHVGPSLVNLALAMVNFFFSRARAPTGGWFWVEIETNG
jgi:hypothetical protein